MHSAYGSDEFTVGEFDAVELTHCVVRSAKGSRDAQQKHATAAYTRTRIAQA